MADARPSRTGLIGFTVLCGLGLGVASCSKPVASNTTHPSVTSTTHTSGPTASDQWCARVPVSLIHSVTGFSVAKPISTVKGSVTECRYQAVDLNHSVIIQVNNQATLATFDAVRSELAAKGLSLGEVTAMGDQAFYARPTAGKDSTNSVVALAGTTLFDVTTTASVNATISLAQAAVTGSVTSTVSTSTSATH